MRKLFKNLSSNFLYFGQASKLRELIKIKSETIDTLNETTDITRGTIDEQKIIISLLEKLNGLEKKLLKFPHQVNLN